jgi:tripartite-type tricarboxylate transporter receptor subunit TctC
VPTFGECGLPNIESDSWVAIFGPKGLPLPIAKRINVEVNKLLEQSDYRERLTKMGFSIREMPQPRFTEVMSEEVAKWSRVLKETGIELK